MSRYQTEAKAASRKRPSTDRCVLGDFVHACVRACVHACMRVCDVVLVGWRQGKNWEESPDSDILWSFVSHCIKLCTGS